MLKKDEIADPKSCLNKAADDEMLFVIREKDPCAIATVLAWINYRIESGKNTNSDAKIIEAMDWCNKVGMRRNGRPSPDQTDS
jgi:hypothetical protein